MEAPGLTVAAARRPSGQITGDPTRLLMCSQELVSHERPASPAPRSMGKDDRREGGDEGTGIGVVTQTKPKTKKPDLYRVLLLNDDFTPMEFVIAVLERFFRKNREDATRIMLHVHQHGVGECGVYTYEVAETKVTQVLDFARKHQHPLQCVMEKK
jgi:ATP-dependent Clp protease adaptor protein ClpS